MVSGRANASPPQSSGKGWLVRLVQRLGPNRVLVTLLVLTVLADGMVLLSVVLDRHHASRQGPPPPVEGLPTPEPTGAPIEGPPAVEAATPAPTQPLGETATPALTQPAATPQPIAPTATRAPRPTKRPRSPGELNLLLLGTDRRLEQGGTWRTDTIMVVSIRPQEGIVAVLSFPRDLWVNIPGQGNNRINAADYYGERYRGRGQGPALVAATLQQRLDIPVDAYVRIHFEGLVRIIDALGGVTITSDRAFDEWMDGSDGPKTWRFKIPAGRQHVNGLTALNYARQRISTGDFDRMRRQQQVLLGIRDAALRPETLPRLPELISALWGAVETDLPLSRVLALVPLATQLRAGAYRTRVLDRTIVRDWVTPNGTQVLLPNWPRIQQVWNELTAR